MNQEENLLNEQLEKRETKRKKVRAILREIQQENPVALDHDNLTLYEVWHREGCHDLDAIIEQGSSAGTILRARNYVLKEDGRG